MPRLPNSEMWAGANQVSETCQQLNKNPHWVGLTLGFDRVHDLPGETMQGVLVERWAYLYGR
jgi:hypothetical protein